MLHLEKPFFSTLYISPLDCGGECSRRSDGGSPAKWIDRSSQRSFPFLLSAQTKLNISSPFTVAALRDYILRFIWPFNVHVNKSVLDMLNWRQAFLCLAFASQYYLELTVCSLVNVTVECETLILIVDFDENSATHVWGLCLPNSCCMILKSKKTKTTTFTDTGILSSAGYNCEIVYNHEKYLLLHCFLCNIWLSRF